MQEMKHLEKQFWRRYKLLALLRIILVFLPQTGYIHPDEYFQSIEILSGDTFDLDSNRPWEFNVTFPIRSIGIPYFTIGLGYKILNTIDIFVDRFYSVINPYSLVVTPRLLMCLLSFLCDYCMYKICVANNEMYKSRLIVLSTSYIIVVYGTRTFSNTFETIFFSLLLYYVGESMIFSGVIVKHQEYFKKRHEHSDNVIDKAKFHKMTLLLAPHNYRNFLAISTIVVLGVFNRPTFFCYALLPVFFWLYRSIGSKSVTTLQFHVRSIFLLVFAVPTVLFLVIIDSFYYGYLTWGEIGMLDISINNFVVPCLNFIKYNWNEKNLEKHGKHPVYLHLFVNIPLLFNILGVYILFGIGDVLKKLCKRKYHLLPNIRSIKGLMMTSMIAPVFLLSLFAHQEPRFIIPIIFPAVYLYAQEIYEEPHDSIVVKEVGNDVVTKSKSVRKKSMTTLKIWLVANAILTIFYGFIHQGGVYPLYNYLSKEVNSHPNTQFAIYTSHVYNIPYTMLLQPKLDKVYRNKQSKFKKTKRVFLLERGSKEIVEILREIDAGSNLLRTKKIRHKLLYVVPSSLDRDVMEVRRNFSEISLRKVRSFYPHLSVEALPDVTDFVYKIAFVEVKSLNFQQLSDSFLGIFKSFGLSLYEIDFD